MAARNEIIASTQRYDTLAGEIGSLRDQVDSVIETWYQAGEPKLDKPENYPWYDESLETQVSPESHIGDLYYDTESGNSYRLLKNDNGTYEWKLLAQTELTGALAEISKLQDAVDGKVAIFYGDTTPTGASAGDLWIKSNGDSYKAVSSGNSITWQIVQN
jgi:hypothetical protein